MGLNSKMEIVMEIVFIKDFNGIKRGSHCNISDHYGNEHIKAGNAVLAENWHGDTENVSRETSEKRTKKKHK